MDYDINSAYPDVLLSMSVESELLDNPTSRQFYRYYEKVQGDPIQDADNLFIYLRDHYLELAPDKSQTEYLTEWFTIVTARISRFDEACKETYLFRFYKQFLRHRD